MRTFHRSMNLAALLMCAFLTGIACAQTFTAIDFPGGNNTQPTAITPSGIIVGRYNSADGNQHGLCWPQESLCPSMFPMEPRLR